MRTFYSRSKNSYITTSFKVMFSSLSKQKSLTQVGRKHLLINDVLCRFCVRKYRKKYLIVRNPYDKLESFFRDKFRNVVYIDYKTTNWQACQRVVFPYLDIDRDCSKEVIKGKLLEFRFSDFIGLLPKIYTRNEHLYPQCWNLERKVVARWVSFTFKQVFDDVTKIENSEELELIGSYFNLDKSIKANSTNFMTEDSIVWDSGMRRIVNNIYSEDFELFGYRMIG